MKAPTLTTASGLSCWCGYSAPLAIAAPALGLAALALAIMALVIRGLWRDLQGRKG
jgi:hypothetical protein